MATTQPNGKTVTEDLFAKKNGAMVKVGEYVPDERRLDSWDGAEYGDELVYVGDRDTWWLHSDLTFMHTYMNSESARVHDVGGYPHDIDDPASDFVVVR